MGLKILLVVPFTYNTNDVDVTVMHNQVTHKYSPRAYGDRHPREVLMRHDLPQTDHGGDERP